MIKATDRQHEMSEREVTYEHEDTYCEGEAFLGWEKTIGASGRL